MTKVDNTFTWTQDSNGNSYISSTLTTADPSQSYAAQKKTNQTLDVYGNVTQLVYYNWGNTSSPYLTENFTYLNSSAYTSRYIFNRMTSSPTTTVSYDGYLAPVSPTPPQWDSSVQNVTARGNPISITGPSGLTTVNYDVTGTPKSITVNGVTSQVTTTTATNWAAPSQLTVNGLSQTMTYSSFLGLTSTTGPNGTSVSIGYDAMARPTSVTSPFGATTTTTYNDTASPPTVVTSVNGRWTQQTLDGFGRTILTATGYGSGGGATTVSQAETVYAPCGCSPLGKMTQQAVPHAPNNTPAYTTYTYDGIGRTIKIVAPDGASTTTYSYQGNTVTVTDPAGAWKTFATDALGNLVQVAEPNPAGGSNYVTTYTYDILGHALTVSMPRPPGTQTRSFAYSGNYLTSATNPENGTVNYTYNSYYKVATRADAKNQQVQYTYDSYARLTQVSRGTLSNGQFTADSCQQENYYYDSNPFNSGYSQNVLGRLAAVQYYGGEGFANQGPGVCDTTYQELYSYSAAGGVTGKQLQLTRTFPTGYDGEGTPTPATATLAATFAYDNEGRMTSEQYPLSGPNMAFAYNSMGRPYSAADQNNSGQGVGSASYNPAGQLLSMTAVCCYSAPYLGQSFTYNSMGQLAGTSGADGAINIQYNYSATQNNGKIISQVDMVSGEQVNFTYDALNRLATAETSANPNVTQWGQSFTYDGFGNLTNVNVIGSGSAPTYSANYNPATNQQYSDCADANGNLKAVLGGACTAGNWYDVENRVITPNDNAPVYGSGGSETFYYYSYAPGNKRVWRGSWVLTGNAWSRGTDYVSFYAPNGQKLAEYSLAATYGQDTNCTPEDPIFYATQTGTYYYFGGRMIKNENGWVYPDRLGSIGKFYPYGTERPAATTNGTEKFTGYFRDAETGNDYAVNRYELPGQGRFMSPDRMTGNAARPGSWNKYAYVEGDPVNFVDPGGRFSCDPADPDCNPGACDPDDPTCDPGVCDPDCGPSPSPAPPTFQPCEISSWSLFSYMSSVRAFDGKGQPIGSFDRPLEWWAPTIMQDAVMDNVDPRLLVAIAFVETKLGALNCAGVPNTNNPFCLGGTKPIPYDNIGQAIQAAADYLAARIKSTTTLADLYNPNSGGAGFCNTSQCSPGPVSARLTQQGGGVGLPGVYGPLQSPCFIGNDGNYYEKQAGYTYGQ